MARTGRGVSTRWRVAHGGHDARPTLAHARDLSVARNRLAGTSFARRRRRLAGNSRRQLELSGGYRVSAFVCVDRDGRRHELESPAPIEAEAADGALGMEQNFDFLESGD